MINRWQLDNELGKVIESVLNCDTINPPNPAFVGLPNPERMYNVVNGRKLYKCEHKSNIQLYLYSDNVNEDSDSNCQIFTESDFIVGIISFYYERPINRVGVRRSSYCPCYTLVNTLIVSYTQSDSRSGHI